MQIEDTPIWQEVIDVVENGPTTTNITYWAIIHYEEGKDYTPLHVTSVVDVRDYTNNFVADVDVTVLMPLGKFARRIWPNRRKLELTLFRGPILEIEAIDDEEKEIKKERFLATLKTTGVAVVENQGMESNDEEILDRANIIEVSFQLRNEAMDKLRAIHFGGVFRQQKLEDTIKAVLTKESKKIQVNQERAIDGVDVVKITNDKEKEQIVFTHGTKLIDVPGYLQKRYGLYNSGMGHHIQDKHWFVYPLYDTTQFNEREVTTTIYVIPANKYFNMERTFKKEGSSVKLIMTGETGFQDDDGIQYLTQGNGHRYTDGTQMVDAMGKTNMDNILTVKRIELNNEYVSEKIENLSFPDIYNAPIIKERITSNPFTVLSSLNARRGGYFKGLWQNHDVTLLTPGMMIRIYYYDKENLIEYHGILHRVESVNLKSANFSSKKFTNQAVVYIYIRRVTPEIPEPDIWRYNE